MSLISCKSSPSMLFHPRSRYFTLTALFLNPSHNISKAFYPISQWLRHMFSNWSDLMIYSFILWILSGIILFFGRHNLFKWNAFPIMFGRCTFSLSYLTTDISTSVSFNSNTYNLHSLFEMNFSSIVASLKPIGVPSIYRCVISIFSCIAVIIS